MDASSDLASSLADAARAINASPSVEDMLDQIVRAAQVSVPGFEHVGISVTHRDGTIETKAATDSVVWELDKLQYSLREGPCVDTLRSERIVIAPDIRHDQRWPRFVPEAVKRTGLQSQLAVQLYVEDKTLGGLNLYSTESREIDPEAPHVAEVFAAHAAVALGRATTEFQLTEAIGHRQDVGTAIGLVMCRYEIDRERAFQFLARASSTSNTKLWIVAQQLIESAEAEYRPTAS
jgi:GAF domain-containing protein